MRVFVAGGTGAIGSHVIPALVREGHAVSALARTPEKAAALTAQAAIAVSVSLVDRSALTAVVGGHDAVVNLASAIPPMTRLMSVKAWRGNDRSARKAQRPWLTLRSPPVLAGRSRSRSACCTGTRGQAGSTRTRPSIGIRSRVPTLPRRRTRTGSRTRAGRGSCCASGGSTGRVPPTASSCSRWPAATSALSWGHLPATCPRSTWPTGPQPSPLHCMPLWGRSTSSMTSH
jgi:NAD(P)H-binding